MPNNVSEADFVKWNQQRESDRGRIEALELEVSALKDELTYWRNEATRVQPRK
jgi:hypothetical protein